MALLEVCGATMKTQKRGRRHSSKAGVYFVVAFLLFVNVIVLCPAVYWVTGGSGEAERRGLERDEIFDKTTELRARGNIIQGEFSQIDRQLGSKGRMSKATLALLLKKFGNSFEAFAQWKEEVHHFAEDFDRRYPKARERRHKDLWNKVELDLMFLTVQHTVIREKLDRRLSEH